MDEDKALIGFFGVLIGTILAGLFKVILEVHKYTNKRISLTRTFRADINTICSIIEDREYITHLRESFNAKQNFTVSINQNYNQIFECNCSEIGILPDDIANDIVIFYTRAKSFLEDAHTHCSKEQTETSYLAYKDMANILELMINTKNSLNKHAQGFIDQTTNKCIYKFINWFF